MKLRPAWAAAGKTELQKKNFMKLIVSVWWIAIIKPKINKENHHLKI
jgi:hypothetical protein